MKLIWVIYFLLILSCATTNNSQNKDSTYCQREPAKVYDEPPPPIVIVPGNDIYADSQNSVIDKVLYAKNEAARKPLRNYLDAIIKMTETAKQGDTDASLAVNNWLLHWANGDALTKVESQQGGFERKWLLSGLLISYIANRPHSGWKQQDKIVDWLGRLTHKMTQDYQTYNKNSQRNNHVYWAGLVAIEMSLVNNDQNLLNWGLEKIRFGLSQIDDNGFLPLELERKSKALQYHRVSLEAFIMAAYLLKDRGFNLLNEQNQALERLAQTTLEGLNNPENSNTKRILEMTPPNWNRALGGRPIELLETGKSNSIRCERIF